MVKGKKKAPCALGASAVGSGVGHLIISRASILMGLIPREFDLPTAVSFDRQVGITFKVPNINKDELKKLSQ